jgi:hypothetical protein
MMRRTDVKRASILDRIVEERLGQVFVGTISVTVEKIAEEIAKEALADGTFRRMIRELVRVRSAALLDQLLRNGKPRRKGGLRAKL